MKNFQKEYSQFLKRFEPFFEKALKEYRDQVVSIARGSFFSFFLDQALSPSKRIRPFLIYAGYKCAGGRDIQKALKLGVAMEGLHTAFLIQDDVIDKSATRRGKYTIHELLRIKNKKRFDSYHYGISTAVLESDFGLNYAYYNAHTLGNPEVSKIFLDMVSETGAGEQIDVDLPFYKLYTNKRLLEKVLELKSGRYSVDRPLALGLALAGKSKWIPKFLEFSNPLGRVFQVADDYLGMFGNEKELGKPTDSDLKEGKATLVIYYGLKKAKPKERNMVLSVLGNQHASKKAIAEVKSILKPYVEQPIKAYIERNATLSLSQLDHLPISESWKGFFKEFIEYLKNRKK